VAVGLRDLYSVLKTNPHQTGRALEVFLLLAGAYLVIRSCLISAVMKRPEPALFPNPRALMASTSALKAIRASCFASRTDGLISPWPAGP